MSYADGPSRLLVLGPRWSLVASRRSNMLNRVWLSAAILLGVSGSLFAQATATINGRIVDQAGAVLPGATITITEGATGVARTTVTNAEGLYSVPALSPGTYNVKA